MNPRAERRFVRIWLGRRAYWLLAAAALFFALGAAYWAFVWLAWIVVALLAGGIVTDALTGPPQRLLSVEREAPEPFALRHPAVLRYHAVNRSRAPVSIALIESPSRLLDFVDDEASGAVPPLSESMIERRVLPVMRGSEPLGAMYAFIENSIGLLRRRMRIQAAQPVRVYPDLSAVERYGALHLRNRLVEAGLRKMRLRGTGTELENLREWSPGDQFRSIEWKATARRGRLMVAEYEVERSQNVMIVLDAGRLMTANVGDQRKFDYAVTAALSLASIASLANDKIGVVAFAGRILRASAPRASKRSLSALASEVLDLQPVFEESDYPGAFAYVRSHVNKRSLIVFFTDMVDPVAQSSVLAEIGSLAKRHLVMCVFMNDRAIENALEASPRAASDVYAAGVALELRDERRTAAAVLARLGVQVVDVPAKELTTALIDRYLMVKQRALL